MLKKNDITELKAESINCSGEAVAFVDKMKVVVPGLFPGETAEVKIVKYGKNVSFGKVITIIDKSPERMESPCANTSCGTCELICARYQYQLELKSSFISEIFHKKISMESSEQKGYRNKIILPVKRTDGKVQIGTYRKNSHNLADWEHSCQVIPEGINSIIRTVRPLLEKNDAEGTIEQLYIRGGSEGYQVGFIVKREHELIKVILDVLFHAGLNIVSTFYSLSAGTNSVLVRDPVYTNGTGTVLLKTDFGSYRMFPTAFFQANIYTLNKILKTIREIIGRYPNESILDLYSGCGVLSDHPGSKRTCVESNGSSFGSIEREEFSEFVVSDASGITERITGGNYGFIIADPPRKGIGVDLIRAINDSQAHTFIYLSCDPVTQKRDIDLLTNYSIDSITAYDMFPNTVQIESLAILKRK